MAEISDIPVIDVSPIYEGGHQAVGNELVRTYAEVGFSYISGHGIDPKLTDGIFEASQRFHALPRESKLAVSLDRNHRGFIPINTSTDVNSKLADVKKPNQSESFMVMREDDQESSEYLSGPNQWPELVGFRDAVLGYNQALSQLSLQMMKAIALGLGADSEELLPHFETPTTWLRLLYYPPTEPDPDGDLYGSAPHTDFGCLTLLAQDQIGGLQVKSGDDWLDVPFKPGTFVLNVGDMLHRWSNGRLKSTPHRVINRSGCARYSCPFFFDPHVSTVIKPLDCCVQKGETPAFQPLVFGEFLRSELEAGYDAHKGTSAKT